MKLIIQSDKFFIFFGVNLIYAALISPFLVYSSLKSYQNLNRNKTTVFILTMSLSVKLATSLVSGIRIPSSVAKFTY